MPEVSIEIEFGHVENRMKNIKIYNEKDGNYKGLWGNQPISVACVELKYANKRYKCPPKKKGEE